MSNKKDPSIAIANAILQVSNLLGIVADQIIKDPYETKGRKTIAKMNKTVAKTAKKIATKAKTPAKSKRQTKRLVHQHAGCAIAIPAGSPYPINSPIAQILMHLCHA